MAETNYNFSISEDTANGRVNCSDLSEEIQASSITIALDRIDTAGDDLDIIFKDELSGDEETTLNTIVADHQGNPSADEAIVIAEEKVGTKGRYQCRGIAFDVPAGSEASETVTWPIPVRVCTMETVPVNDGDTARAVVGEDTVVGAITANVAIGDQEVSVSDTVLENIDTGYQLKLDNGSESETFFVVNVNHSTKKIALDHEATKAFSATDPTYCKMSILMTYNPIEFSKGIQIEYGAHQLGGALIPANVPLKIYYKNADPDNAIRIRIMVEYWY